jgi:hypothetical protein
VSISRFCPAASKVSDNNSTILRSRCLRSISSSQSFEENKGFGFQSLVCNTLP